MTHIFHGNRKHVKRKMLLSIKKICFSLQIEESNGRIKESMGGENGIRLAPR
jgi:hypothetical protein